MRRLAIAAAALALISVSLFFGLRLADRAPQSHVAGAGAKPSSTQAASTRAAKTLLPAPAAALGTSSTNQAANAEEHDAIADQAEIARCKQIDIEHMTLIYKGIMAYHKKYGHYPEQLSQLAPEFVTTDVLSSPRKKADVSNGSFSAEHADPGVAKPSYAFEFSNVEFRDGRTFAEIKEIQRTEWGDVVPMLRSFAYDKVINVSCRGDEYETQLNWEWDTATLDLAEQYGWGPGLTVGEMVKVRVLRPDGSPAAGAQVWADGRNYSFDLPNRPFTADDDGWAAIPIGVDTDRTALVLRAEVPGYASPTNRSDLGDLPQGRSLTLAPSQRIGGTAMSADGRSMPHARVFLQQTTAQGATAGFSSPPMISVVADAQGRWSAHVHPDEIAGLAAMIGEPAGAPFKHIGAGAPLNASAAKAGNAVVTAARTK